MLLQAALKGMKIFITTLIEVCQAQRRLHTSRLAAQVDGSGSLSSPQASVESLKKVPLVSFLHPILRKLVLTSYERLKGFK